MNQTAINFGAIERDKGIKKSIDHADAVNHDWSEKAYECFKLFLKWRAGNFQCETFREFSKGMLPAPPSLRAYGHVIRRAAKDNLIRQVGYNKVSNPTAHMANSAVWEKI